MSKRVVLITSASGRIGKELLALLSRNDDFVVRACSFSQHNHQMLTELGADEVVPFDLNDAATWSAALDGVHAVYSASLDPMLEGHLAFCEEPGTHGNKFYDLTGPEPQTMAEIAEDLGRAMGRTLEYRPQSMEDFERDFGSTRAEFFEYLSNGFYCRCSPDFYNLTGHKPTSYADYLATPGASGETGLDELWQGNLWKKGVDAMKDAAAVEK